VCGNISAISLRVLPDHVSCGFGLRLWVWEYFRDFVAGVAGSCHVSCGFGFCVVGGVWEYFRDFVAAVAGLCHVSCGFWIAFVGVGIFPRFRCGCCRIVSCELWLWILRLWVGCGNISAISLRLLPDCVM
jgi:hypothetical protein